MADSRLTDLQAKTVISNDDIFYVVDISENTSNKLTFNSLIDENLLTTSGRISSTITNPLCSDVIDIHNDLLSKATNIVNLTQSSSSLNTKITSVSTQVGLGQFEYNPLSTVQAGSFLLPGGTIGLADGAHVDYTIPIGNIIAGDTILLFPPIGLGDGSNNKGLSGLQYSFNALSSNGAELHLFNETGVQINILSNSVFRYAAQRLALPFTSISGSF